MAIHGCVNNPGAVEGAEPSSRHGHSLSSLLCAFSAQGGITVNKAEIPFLSASELSRLIEKKEVSPVEVTEADAERIYRAVLA